MSEIDDIFSSGAAKPALSKATSVAGPSKKAKSELGQAAKSTPASTDKGKQKTTAQDVAPNKKRKATVVEAVFDPSVEGSRSAKKAREPTTSSLPQSSSGVERAHSAPGRKDAARGTPYVAPSKGLGDNDDIFQDSRGTIAQSKRKITEEGFRVFTETELGMDRPDAGETDLCPFDCDCCF